MPTKRKKTTRRRAAKRTSFGYPLNDEQRRAVTHGDGPLLIVAGAGTGKTTVITERIAWLIREGRAKPEEILALTFTDKAAGEMEERVDRLLPYGYVDLWVSTFHAFGERVLREYGLEIGLNTNFKLLATADQWLLLRRNLERFNLEYYRPLGNPTKFLQALIEHFSRAKDEAVAPPEYRAYAEKRFRASAKNDEEQQEAARILEVAKAYEVYDQLLRDSGHLDFGDLILQTLRLFRERRAILKDFRGRFRYILVDEFQDTNFAQYELVKLVAAPKNNITAVGDDDQSIYKFRGAAVSNILEFKKDFPASREIVLTANYRSRQNLLDLAYRFIQQNNPHRLEAQLAAREIGPKGMPLRAEVSKHLKASATGKGAILYEAHETEETEAARVVERIAELKAGDPGATWNDFAILLRANRQADVYARRLERSGMPYQFQAARGLYQRPEVLDLISFLKMLDNYHESPAFFRVLSMPVFRVPHRDVTLLSRAAAQKHTSLYLAAEHAGDVAELSPEGRKAIARTLDLIHEHAELARRKSVGEVLYQFFQHTKYFDRFDRDRDQDTILNIAKFYRRIREFEEANDDSSLKAFMEETNLMLEIGEDPSPVVTEEGPEAVKLMTVHGAKGLEFSYVFLPQLVDQRFPSRERREIIPLPDALVREIVFDGHAHLEEERRLFYVALTRAKKGLFFSSAEDYGGARKKKPSRFLFEIGFVKAVEKPSSAKRQLDLALPPAQRVPTRGARAQYERPSKFSYTQLAAFRTCPKQYWYAHILRIPVTGNSNFSFGKSVHATLKAFFEAAQKGTVPAENDLIALYEQEWIGDWYASDDDERRRKQSGEQALREFYRRNKGEFPKPIALERGFSLKLGQYALKGFIDRIDPVSSEAKSVDLFGGGKQNRRMGADSSPLRVDIIDYKTGSVPKSKKEEDLDQLMLYAMAAVEVFGFKPRKLIYSYIEHGTDLAFDVSENTLERAKARVLETIAAIEQSDFRATPGFWCQFCDFRDICEDRAV